MFTKIKALQPIFFLAGVALCLALLIRVPSFGSLPRGLNRDEAALGYNAFSILKTGHDEHNVKFPVTFHSFGDEKLGGYIYSLLPFIKIFGLKTWVVRLPSFLAGLSIIASIGAITYQVTRSFWKPREQAAASALAMIGVAISPWGNHFSRVAYEAHLAMACFLFGWFALQKALDKNASQRYWLAGAGLAFAYSLITYHSYQVIVPLFLLGTVCILQKKLFSLDKVGTGIGICFGLLAIAGLILSGAITANQKKHAGISPYSQEILTRQFASMRLALPTPSILNKGISNKVTEAAFTLSKNITSTLSPDFLFVSGTSQDVHNPGGMANLHLFLFPCILLGIIFLCKQKSSQVQKFFWLWFFVALIPSSLTIAPAHTIRANALFPALEVLGAVGLVATFLQLKKNFKTLAIIFYVAILTASTLRMWGEYAVLAPKRDEAKSHEKFHLLAKKIQEEKSKVDRVYTQQPNVSPYIWYLFESQFDPSQLQEKIVFYDEDEEHFQHVKQIDSVYFTTITWDDLKEQAQDKSLSLIFRPEEVPGEIRDSNEYKYQESLHDHFGNEVYQIWHIGPLKN